MTEDGLESVGPWGENVRFFDDSGEVIDLLLQQPWIPCTGRGMMAGGRDPLSRGRRRRAPAAQLRWSCRCALFLHSLVIVAAPGRASGSLASFLERLRSVKARRVSRLCGGVCLLLLTGEGCWAAGGDSESNGCLSSIC